MYLQLAAAGISLLGSMRAASDARSQGRNAARQYKENAEMDKLRALQEKNARVSNFNASMSTVDAQAGFANRSERSIAAVRKRGRNQIRKETDKIRNKILHIKYIIRTSCIKKRLKRSKRRKQRLKRRKNDGRTRRN